MFLVGIYLVYNVFATVKGIHPEVRLNLEQRIKRHGYPVETHQVTTRDGYLLNMYRLPHGLQKQSDSSKNKSSVLFVHGQGGSPHNFVALGRKTAPAYYFADRGFDVWLFCARGVECHSLKKHKTLDWNKDPLYWDFGFHDIALNDLSASIDLILNKTGQKQLFFVGHSTGASELHALLSEMPYYNDKIKLITNWAPVLIEKEVDYPFLQVVASFSTVIKNIYAAMGLYEVLPHFLTVMLADVFQKSCADPKWFRLCKVTLWCTGSHVSTLIQDDVVEVALSGMPPRLSIKQLTHFMDNINKGEFRKYDYGPKSNVYVYGKKIAPVYNFSAATAPNAFFYGATDSLTVQGDIWALQRLVPNTILDYQIGPKFTHLDFLFARTATHMVYEPTVKLLKDVDAGIIPPKVIR